MNQVVGTGCRFVFRAMVFGAGLHALGAGAAETVKSPPAPPVGGKYCYDCHGDGGSKGGGALGLASRDNRELWWKVLKNVRANVMPPHKKAQPSAADREALAAWIKREAFAIDPAHPDPGRVALRRLNRTEYRNTIRDLMGVEFNTTEEFPPDDTGYGFDTIADVLSVSPLLLEKYMQAAERIVNTAVPTAPKVVAETTLSGKEFRTPDGSAGPDRMSFYKEADA